MSNPGQPSNKTGLDKLLAEWPIQEPSALDWDENAAHIEARIARGFKTDDTGEMRTYMTDEEIFSPAAGQTEKDGHNTGSPGGDGGAGDADETGRMPQQIATGAQIPTKAAEDSKMSLTSEQRERDRKSLQDLARMAQMTPQPPSSRTVPVAQPSVPASGVVSGSAKTEKQDDVMLPASRTEDSGLVNFSALSAPPPASSRDVSQVPPAPNTSPMLPSTRVPAAAPHALLAQEGLFDEEPASARPQSVAPHALMATLPSGGVPQGVQALSERPSAVSVASVVPPSLATQVAPQKKSGAVVYMIGAVVALAAVAAGGFFIVKPRLAKSEAPVAVATPGATGAPVVQDVPVPTTRWQDQVVAQNTAPSTQGAPSTDLTVSPASLPPADAPVIVAAVAKSGASKAAPVVATKGRDGASSKPDNKLADQLVAAAPPTPAPLPPDPMGTPAAKNAAPAGSVNGGNLDVAMKAAAGPGADSAAAVTTDTKPQFAAGSVPQHPSQGAVTGAIGAALPEARACLGADDPVSKATMIFGSDGSVQSVNVHGAAAGKPAEACIKTALMKAKVPPFAESTYTANITVRH